VSRQIARQNLRKIKQWPAGAAERIRDDAREQHAALHPASRAFPAAAISFNLRSGSSLSDAIPAIQKAERENGLPDTIETTFTGAAAEFRSSLTSEPLLILAAVVVNLHRARRSVRKLHSSNHDSFDIAICRRRRVARAAHLPHRFFFGRAYRHHPPDRHRKKERDHDDRFCARSRTQGRDVARGIDLSSMSAAVSAHHDDNGGGIVGRIATCPREWNWQRIAEPRSEFPSSEDCCSHNFSRSTRRR